MRALVVLCLCVGLAHAAPKYQHTASASTDPAMREAERKWTVAAASRGPAQSDLWEDAASAFIAIVDAKKLPEADLAHAAHAALLAFKNSLNTDPRTKEKPPGDRDRDHDYEAVPIKQDVTARDLRMIHLLEVAESYEADPDEKVSLRFLRANIWRRYNRFDKSSPLFLDIIESHRTALVAEYAANLLLDTYNRMQSYDELIALANKLRKDKAFLANRRDLARTVNQVFAQSQGMIARAASQRARNTGDRKQFEICAEAYLSILDGVDRQSTDDEVLYNAMICFEQAGNIDRAVATLRRLTTDFPDSQLTKRADLHSISMLATVGRYDDAAAAGEKWLRANALERDAADVLEDTVQWHIASGSLDAAVRILEDYTSRAKRVPLLIERRAMVAVTLADAIIDDARTRPTSEYSRRRATAIRILGRAPPLSRTIDNDGPARVAVARAYANAACPIALVDGLCLRKRDIEFMATARREIARIANPIDASTLFLADLALEAILVDNAPTSNLSADYEHLTQSSDPDVRIAAHARLATLANHAKDSRARTKQLEACLAEGYASHGGDTWRTICERDLSLRREVLPPPRAFTPITIEPPLTPHPEPTASSSPRTRTIDFPDDVID